MMEPAESLRFIIDTITRQYQELKHDLRVEMSTLKQDLSSAHTKHDSNLLEFKDDVGSKFKATEGRLSSLEAFKWKTVGVVALAVIIVEVYIR